MDDLNKAINRLDEVVSKIQEVGLTPTLKTLLRTRMQKVKEEFDKVQSSAADLGLLEDEDEPISTVWIIVPQAWRHPIQLILRGMKVTIHDSGYTDGSTSYAFLIDYEGDLDKLRAELEEATQGASLEIRPYVEGETMHKEGV